VETLVSFFAHALVVLFIIGTIGCLLVIPWTAVELIKAMLEPDTEEANGTSQTRSVS